MLLPRSSTTWLPSRPAGPSSSLTDPSTKRYSNAGQELRLQWSRHQPRVRTTLPSAGAKIGWPKRERLRPSQQWPAVHALPRGAGIRPAHQVDRVRLARRVDSVTGHLVGRAVDRDPAALHRTVYGSRLALDLCTRHERRRYAREYQDRAQPGNPGAVVKRRSQDQQHADNEDRHADPGYNDGHQSSLA